MVLQVLFSYISLTIMWTSVLLGLSAALAARRAGADVILMEKFGCFGGVITTVGMETIAWYR